MKLLVVKNGNCKTYIDSLMSQIDNKIECDIVHCSKILDIDYVPNAVIVLGGTVSVRDIDFNKDLQNVLKYFDICAANKIPVLGICLGCQLIAKHFGSEVVKANKPMYGFKDIIVSSDIDDKICECIIQNNKMYVSLHNDYIIPSNELEVYAICEDYPYYIKRDNFYGVQFHPDVVEGNLTKFIKCFDKEPHKYKEIRQYFMDNKEHIVRSSLELLNAWINIIK